jgi:Fic family protein
MFGKKVEVNIKPDLDPNMNVNPNVNIDPKSDVKTKTSNPPRPTKPQNRRKSKQQKLVKGTILKTIKKHKDGINTKDLQQLTGFTGKQISNNMFHLKKENKVEKTTEGLFIAL